MAQYSTTRRTARRGGRAAGWAIADAVIVGRC
jgi:hypothetical protein